MAKVEVETAGRLDPLVDAEDVATGHAHVRVAVNGLHELRVLGERSMAVPQRSVASVEADLE